MARAWGRRRSAATSGDRHEHRGTAVDHTVAPRDGLHEPMIEVTFRHDGRWLQAETSPGRGAFRVVVLDQGKPVSKPLVICSAMVCNPTEAAELMISLVKHNLCELSGRES
jgi:hypothetical protein